jgi:methionine-S-sulfoxide reductase
MAGEAAIAVLLALPVAVVLLLLQRQGLLGCGVKRIDSRHRAILAKPDPQQQQQHHHHHHQQQQQQQHQQHQQPAATVAAEVAAEAAEDAPAISRIVLAAGCFWGVQLAFQRLPGVRRTAVGYIGGQGRNPTYQQVCSGRSGHAEAVEVEYDPTVISLQELFVVFFSVHDATTLNRQGNDVGTQYRSAIFFRDQEEKAAVRNSSAAILFDDTAPSRSVSSQ